MGDFGKIGYGAAERAHRHAGDGNGALARAEVTMLDENPVAAGLSQTRAPMPASTDV